MRTVLFTILVVASLNAGDKFTDLSREYIATLSANVKLQVALDTQTSKETLEILSHDNELKIRLAAKNNLLKNSLFKD